MARLSQLGRGMTALVAVVFLLVLSDLAFAAVLVSSHKGSLPATTAAAQHASNATDAKGPTKSGHPCNHGFYVSKAAHSKKGGPYVSAIAQSNLGKDGNCTAPLPAVASAGS